MSRQLLLIDLALAVIIAAVLVVLSPGVAVALIVAVLVLAVCGLSFAVEAVIRRRRLRWYRRRYYESGK